ncbi:hypothetical protein SUGI_0820380 [Cryptomeria japonica]|uniref:uncharacterized protein LOC131033217 isoform X2 n=1 Tax=Cryptomeria japonica TaxID=3369 RepID=UPI0024149D09|nr:uncharacterized protein LOC131033217 isoform X2 [Cryptomeria japonica]GLJ40066.1 hypothetical protein SUGI_0820380 [Cryptomeria japonica]
MKGSRESQGWGNKRVQFQEPYNKMSKSSGASSGAWKPAVPFWEREFCESVGLSWSQVCDNNNELEGFDNVLRWDDSAALEAFQIAKQRYWAKRNGRSYDIPLPSSDLYIDEIDWNSHIQEDCEIPERNNSSSEEDYRRPYFKQGARGRQGRRRNISRPETQDHRKPSEGNAHFSVNMLDPTAWTDNATNAPKDGQKTGPIEWSENRQNATEMSKDFAQNPLYIQPTGWEDQHDAGWDVKQTDHSAWEAHENNNVLTGWEQKMDSGWGNQTEPTRNSTITSKTAWTDTGNVMGDSVGWGDQTQNGLNAPAVGSGWTPHKEENYTSGQGCGNENSGWGSKHVSRTGWNNVKDVSEWESGIGSTSPFIPQEQVIATGWGDQFPEQVHSYYQNHACMPAQWNTMPQAAQWQNQSATWNPGPVEMQYQFNGNWGGPPCNSFHQGGSHGWYQAPAYPQSAWRSNQGNWHQQPQHKQGGYPAQNHHYALKKDRDYRVINRRNQR